MRVEPALAAVDPGAIIFFAIVCLALIRSVLMKATASARRQSSAATPKAPQRAPGVKKAPGAPIATATRPRTSARQAPRKPTAGQAPRQLYRKPTVEDLLRGSRK